MTATYTHEFPVTKRPRFPIGQLVITRAALELLSPEDVGKAIVRHITGDWGNICPEDKQANEDALVHGDRLLSAYGDKDRRFWIITEADRSVTTILLPEDY
jgi:hypothetical protein